MSKNIYYNWFFKINIGFLLIILIKIIAYIWIYHIKHLLNILLNFKDRAIRTKTY